MKERGLRKDDSKPTNKQTNKQEKGLIINQNMK